MGVTVDDVERFALGHPCWLILCRDARADERASRHAAEDDEVHDRLHGPVVLQSGQRSVPLFHRIEPVGLSRATIGEEKTS